MKFTYPGGSRPLEGYTIKRGIGRGGFGEVYYATSDAGKEVALKLIRRNLEIEVRGVTQCLNLKHPNLLALFDIRRDAQDDTWVVMEYISGESLEDVIARHPQGLPLEEALAWLYGIAAGVGYLHDRGIVHRDLKPGNVFSDEGCVKIGDYGLSKFISSSRRSGQTESVGTVHYMAPEVANGRYGKEIDTYALGIILYEMLTGRVPFEGESVGEVLMKHLTAEPDLSALAEPFRSVVARCLDKDPDKRFQSVGDFLAMLPPSKQNFVRSNPAPQPLEETMAWGRPAAAPIAPLAGMAAVGAAVGAGAAVAGAGQVVGFWETEPLYCFCRDVCRDMGAAWKRAELNPMASAIVVVLALVALVTVASLLFPLSIFYGIYLIVRAIWYQPPITGASPPPLPRPTPAALAPAMAMPAAAPPAAAPPVAGPRAQPLVEPQVVATPGTMSPVVLPSAARRSRRRGMSLLQRPERTAKENFTELLGSMLLSAAICASLNVIAALWFANLASPERLVWLAMVSTLGSWCILVPAKFWEGRQGEELLRRMVLLCLGLGLGAAAFGIDQLLLVELPSRPELRFNGAFVPPGGDARGQPLVTDYLAYFGLLLPVFRWWRQVDPSRRARFNPWNAVICGLGAYVLSWVWNFPQPWGFCVALSISAASQLASPWLDPQETAPQQAA